MTPVMLAILILSAGLVSPQETRPGDKPSVPKDSIELTVIGCLKGRVLKTVARRPTDVESGPYVGERTFRLASKKEITQELKRQQNRLVEVTGIVKRSDLEPKGVRIGGVTVGSGNPVSGSRGIPSPAENVTVMDVTAVRMRSSTCGGE